MREDKLLYEHLVEDSLMDYKSIYQKTDITDVANPYYKEAITLFQELSKEQQKVLFKIINQTQIDTVSHFLGILDGTSTLESNIDFLLTLEDRQTKLNGDLQDYFIELVEEKE
ncbi:transposase [Bacillus salacetis]|uniref:transposase n=1 Tax=Bacillus salacetis TaxID=2315464 RepID=UPI003BA1A8EA